MSREAPPGESAQPAAPAVQPEPVVPPDVLKAAQDFVANGYRGPLPWAKKVFDWVAAAPAVQPAPEPLPLPPLRKLASGVIGGKYVELRGWYEEDLPALRAALAAAPVVPKEG